MNELLRATRVCFPSRLLTVQHSSHLLKQPRETSLDLMNKLLSFLLEQILTPANESSHFKCPAAAAAATFTETQSDLDDRPGDAIDGGRIYRGNHFACSTQGSSPDSQQRRPPSQQKHLTSSLRPRQRECDRQCASPVDLGSFWEETVSGTLHFQDFPAYRKTNSIFCPKTHGKPLSAITKLLS